MLGHRLVNWNGNELAIRDDLKLTPKATQRIYPLVRLNNLELWQRKDNVRFIFRSRNEEFISCR
jgi:hypothetical protein